MSSKGKKLLNIDLYPKEKEDNVIGLYNQVKSGNLGISISSFEDIFNITTPGVPFPVGCVNFDDNKKRFVISWIESFSKIGLTEVDEYKVRLRHYPGETYPVISLLVSLHNGKVDPDTGEELWYNKECHLDIGFLLTRIKLYQFLNCEEILFCLFDEKPENLDSFGFSLNKNELNSIEEEILSSIDNTGPDIFENHIKRFTDASCFISKCFTPRGLPKTKDALNVYLCRKKLNPKPGKHNWEEYLSI